MFCQTRNRTRLEYIVYAIHLYFLGLSLRNTSIALSRFVKRSHTAIRDWIQKYKPQKLLSKRKKIDEYIVDETQLKVGSELIWLWVAIEPKNRQILALCIIQREKYVCSRKIYWRFGQETWTTSYFHRRRYLVSSGL